MYSVTLLTFLGLSLSPSPLSLFLSGFSPVLSCLSPAPGAVPVTPVPAVLVAIPPVVSTHRFKELLSAVLIEVAISAITAGDAQPHRETL